MSRKVILQRFLDEVWSGGNVDAADRYVADNYEITNDPGDPWHGKILTRDEFKDRLVKSRAAAPDQKFLTRQMVEEGDSIAVSWEWSGTHLGDLPGIPATGKSMKMTGLTIYSFDRDDRLTGHWQVVDRLGIYQQLMNR